MAAQSRLVSEALETMSGWVLERSADPGEFTRLPGTQIVFDLKASDEFGAKGRYGANATVWYVLVQLGLLLLYAAVFAYAAWNGCKTLSSQHSDIDGSIRKVYGAVRTPAIRMGQRSTVDIDTRWMRRISLLQGLSGSVNLIALVFFVLFALPGSSNLFWELFAGVDPILHRVTSQWAWLSVAVAAVFLLLLAWVCKRNPLAIRGCWRYGVYLTVTAGFFWLLSYWHVLEFRF